ncbi:hypothetical protein ACMHYB_38545 [Sorangium sp. So ce1128]
MQRAETAPRGALRSVTLVAAGARCGDACAALGVLGVLGGSRPPAASSATLPGP